MSPERFAESNTTFAESQPEYIPLPAWTDGREVISCWRLTWRERVVLLLGGRLWHRTLTFGQPLQPQLITTDHPFGEAR